MPKLAIEYLKHIRDECRYLVHAIPDGMDEAAFTDDETLKRAVVRS